MKKVVGTVMGLMILANSLIGSDDKVVKVVKSKEEYYKEYKLAWEKYLSIEQKLIIIESINMGKVDGIGWSAGAISFIESVGGQRQINVNDNGTWDCGEFGGNTATVLKRAGARATYANKQMVCTKLIQNKKYAYGHMKKELNIWKEKYTNSAGATNWAYVWSSYNSGGIYMRSYSNKIAGVIRFLNEKINGMTWQVLINERDSSIRKGKSS